MPANINDFLAHFVTDLNNRYVAALSDLSDEQLAYRPNADANHIGFLAWHVLRTEDNVINYLCQGRKTTVWLQQALNVRWGLPKAAQGTGMEPREAYALRVPGAADLVQYANDLTESVRPFLETVDGLALRASIRLGPERRQSMIQLIGQGVLAHGNVHLGQVLSLRTAQGLPVTGY